MAVHTYIGARYVPRFVGVYDPTQQYEALDVVDNGSGTSYIARITVPAGTPLTDTTYWFVYGASSGAILNLQQQINDIHNIDIPRIDGDIDAVDDRVDLLVNKNIIIVGDSYGTRLDTDGKTVAQALSDRGYNIVFDYSYGGAGFLHNGAYDIATYPQMYTGDYNEVTDIFFCCSANDAVNDFANLRNAVENAIVAAKTSFPNAKIHIFPWGCIFKNEASAYYLDYITLSAYRTACEIRGAEFVENAQYILRNTNLLDSDYIHPLPLGVNYLWLKLADAINGNEVHVQYDITPTVTNTDSSITGFASATLRMTRKDGTVELSTDANLGTDMFVIEHTPTTGVFIPSAQGLILDQSLISYPYSTVKFKRYPLHGFEAVVGGSPIPVCSAVMNITPYRDQLIFCINPSYRGGNVTRFFATDAKIVFYD